jgi:PIN domain nuclease of toxin-antitoxin system
VRDLPLLHRDPFDRLLVAQAIVEGLVLVTGDRLLLRYGIPVLLA